jgi:predicted acyltransferase
MEAAQPSVPIRTTPKERLLSLDTLRGFDMVMLMAGCGIIATLADATGWGWLRAVAMQTEHVEWEGFRFYDLIFPLFMFVSGVAIPYAIQSKLEKGMERSRLLKKIAIRLVALFGLGLLYNGATQRGFTDLRYASVLFQIGFGYFFAALIFLYSRSIKLPVVWLVHILIIVTILQLFIPIPGYGAGSFEPAGTINAWLDQRLIPGRLYDGVFDPEGFLCMVSAIAVTLMGGLAGYVIRSTPMAPGRKSLYIGIAGLGLILVALMLSPVYPIIKKMWTVPYVLLAAGISAVLLSLFYYVIDVRGSRNWTLFFRVFGMNSITIYVGARIVSFSGISRFFLNWISVHFSEAWGAVFIAMGVLVIEWGVLYFLYKKQIFLRV